MKTQRSIKLQGDLRKRYNTRDIWVPQLRLSGKWLEEAGFKIGDQIRIEVSEGQLILKTPEV